jgi:acyl-CoA synthetase (AMP-forming)/AMP-acid ligase II
MGSWAEAALPQVVRGNAERYRDRVAIVDGDRALTFAEFDRAMVGAVRAMMASGLALGDRVAVWAPNSADWLIAAMGVLGAGGVLLPVNSRLRGAEVAQVLRRTQARAIFTVGRFLGDDYPSMLREADPGLDLPVIDLQSAGEPGAVDWSELLARGAEEVPETAAAERIAGISPADVCDILFTSGTTGTPKGVVVTHETNMNAWTEYGKMLELGPRDKILLIPPLGLIYGLKAIFMVATLTGAGIVVQSVFSAEAAMHAIEEHGITYLTGPPTLFQDILDSPKRSDYDLASLTRALLAGTYIQPALVSRVRSEGLTGNIYVSYGQSENGPVTSTRPDDDADTIANTVGRPVDGVKLRIVDDDENDLDVGRPGEILVQSMFGMHRYYEDPVQTANAYTGDGWFRTGDIGALDERGYVRIIGRKKDMLIVGGFNVYPAEVERCLVDHGSIAEAVVVPAPDERLGEVGVAFVVPRTDADANPDALMAWARDRLANYKVPRLISVADTLPRNASSKVLRDVLRVRAAEITRGSPVPGASTAEEQRHQ